MVQKILKSSSQADMGGPGNEAGQHIYFYCYATQTFGMCFNYENFVSTSYSITKNRPLNWLFLMANVTTAF